MQHSRCAIDMHAPVLKYCCNTVEKNQREDDPGAEICVDCCFCWPRNCARAMKEGVVTDFGVGGHKHQRQQPRQHSPVRRKGFLISYQPPALRPSQIVVSTKNGWGTASGDYRGDSRAVGVAQTRLPEGHCKSVQHAGGRQRRLGCPNS